MSPFLMSAAACFLSSTSVQAVEQTAPSQEPAPSAVVQDVAPSEDAEPNLDTIPVEELPESYTPLAPAFSELDDQALFTAAFARIEEIDTMTAAFEQTSPSGVVSTGTLSLNRPGRLRFDYTEPSDQLVVAVGGNVYVHDAELETTDTYPLRKTPLRFLLDRTIDLEAAQLVEVSRSPFAAAITVEAKDEDVPGRLALVFSAPNMELIEWVVQEPNGAVTRVALSDVEYDVKIPGRLFRVPDSGGSLLRDR